VRARRSSRTATSDGCARRPVSGTWSTTAR
jgi:hypothetical protein